MKTRSLMNVGLFTVLYLVVMLVIMVPIPFLPVGLLFLPMGLALVEGTVYQLFLQRIDQRGMLFLFSSIIPVVLTLTGRYWTTAAFGIVCGFLAEVLAASGNYQDPQRNRWSYLIFSLWGIGPLMPLWLLPQSQLAQGNQILQALARWTPYGALPVIALAVLVCAWIGDRLGQRMVHKHFRRYLRQEG